MEQRIRLGFVKTSEFRGGFDPHPRYATSQKNQDMIPLKKTLILTEDFNSFLILDKQITGLNHFPFPSSQLFHNKTL
jgi:hypothetical protein